MAGCSDKMKVWIDRGFHGKEITVKCGSTSPYGSPWLCQACEELPENQKDWRREAELNGEQWDEDY